MGRSAPEVPPVDSASVFVFVALPATAGVIANCFSQSDNWARAWAWRHCAIALTPKVMLSEPMAKSRIPTTIGLRPSNQRIAHLDPTWAVSEPPNLLV